MLTHRLNRLLQRPWIVLILLISFGVIIKLIYHYENLYHTYPVSTEKTKLHPLDLVYVSRYYNFLPAQLLKTTPVGDHGKTANNKGHFNAKTRHINFNNISKLETNKVFEILTDYELPDSNWSSYEENITAKNYLDFSYLISGEDICKKDVPYVLIIIPSVIKEIDRRDLIRKTWLRAAETNSWPREEVLDKVKHIFFFGLHENARDEELEFLMKESLLNNDIVVADFEDSYRNLSIKMLVSLKWTMKYCAEVKFILKVDMDTFINVPLMMSLLHYVESNITSDKFIIGLKHSYDKPVVVRDTGRWKVSQSEYPLSFYPKHMYGHTYAVSIGIIAVLLLAAEKKPIIAPEDAFITGILPKLTGVLRLNAPSFTVCCREIFDCEIVWNTNVAITDIKHNEILERLWTSIVSGQCNNTHSMNEY